MKTTDFSTISAALLWSVNQILMKFTNYHGVANFLMVGIKAEQYRLREMKSGHLIETTFESLADIDNVERDINHLILPGQQITLYVKWDKRWLVYPLRPGQCISPETLVESQELECKSQGIRTFEEDVCAMANSSGGCILWGVNDAGEVTDGVKKLLAKYGNEDKLTCHLRNRLRQNTNTLLFMSVKFDFLWKGCYPILKISVPSSNGNIVLFKDSLFVRSDNSTQRLSGDRMLQFIYSKFINKA